MTTPTHARTRTPHSRPPPRASTLAVALLLVAGTFAIVTPGVVGADSTTIMNATLPTPRFYTSAVWTGTYAYVFGGFDTSSLNQIIRYDPATDTIATMNANLGTGRHDTMAVWTGQYAYVFGGFSRVGANAAYLDEILQYDPVNDTVVAMNTRLPSPMCCGSAVWTGQHAYIIGGSGSNAILRYDPATDTITPTSATLPGTSEYSRTSSVWNGQYVYIFGGSGNDGFTSTILQYDPDTDQLATMGATLPTDRRTTSAVWDGQYAYVFGGNTGSSGTYEIVRYDPAMDTAAVMNATLPTPRYRTSAVWSGTNAYVFGGWDGSKLDQIVRYSVDQPPPTACINPIDPVNLSINVTSCSMDPENDTLAHDWDWGDGTPPATSPAANHTYACDGTFTITLTVSDGRGGTDSISEDVTVADVDNDKDGLSACREVLQGTSDTTNDTDGDALTDYMESVWWPDRETVFCPSGATHCLQHYPDPVRKDIYVEMDHMGSDRLPSEADLERIRLVFLDSPHAGNPDNSTGIFLHLDAGSSTTLYNMGGANSVPHDEHLGTAESGCWDYNWDEFDAIKNAHFSPARVPVFHYMVWADKLAVACGSTSGISRNVDTNFGAGASDFIVSLGGWKDDGSPNERVGTFIHELGHNLGLRHGGFEHNNNKSNYLSVMNYLFQTKGIPRTDGTSYFGYSQFVLPDLNEAMLDESVGLNSEDADTWGTRWYCWGNEAEHTTSANGPVNWDCDGQIDPLPTAVDLNNDGDCVGANIVLIGCDTHKGSQDWGNLVFHGNKVIGSGGSGAGISTAEALSRLPRITPQVEELTFEEDQAINGV